MLSSAAFRCNTKNNDFFDILSQSTYFMLSLGVGARLDSILQIVCFRTSDVSIDNLVYFFHNLTLIVWYSEASIGKIN
ncbi:MAG TPA: hypothetical protein VF084_00905 [Nitrososphaeraceae archaeon]